MDSSNPSPSDRGIDFFRGHQFLPPGWPQKGLARAKKLKNAIILPYLKVNGILFEIRILLKILRMLDI